MTRQADHTDIMGEIFTAELGTETELTGGFQQLLLQLTVAEGASQLITGIRQIVIIFGRCQFHRFQVHFR